MKQKIAYLFFLATVMFAQETSEETNQNTSIEEVLQSDKYQNLVKNYKKIDLCKTCNMRKPN